MRLDLAPARLLAAALLVVLGPPALTAQVRYLVNEPGRWQPWEFEATQSARSEIGATPAEVKAFEQRLLALGEILRRTPVASEPKGFAVGAHGYLAGYRAPSPEELRLGKPAGRSLPLAGGYGLGAFALFEYDRDGKTVREESIATELLYFEVNQIQGGMFLTGKPTEWGAADTEGFLEPVTKPGVQGLPQLGDVFVLKNNPKPLWLPLPLAEALQPVVQVRGAELATRRAAYDKEVAEFASWQTPTSRAARKADWQTAAKLIPNGDEFLKNMEDSERQIEAFNRERLAPEGEEATAVAASEREYAEAKAALDSLNAQQRAAASCYDDKATTFAARFRTVNDAPGSCRPLVRANWGFFDSSLPRSAPQVVMLNQFTRCFSAESLQQKEPSGCNINRKLVETLDWDAVRAWLDR